MTLVSSLRGRIFLASALLAVLSIVAAIFVVNQRVTREAESALQREVRATGALVEELRKTRVDTYTVMARLIADLPKLKAAVLTNDPPTVQDNLRDYQEPLKSANLLLVTNATGRVLASSGDSSPAGLLAVGSLAVHDALLGHETVSLLPEPDGILQVVTVPIPIGLTEPQILGSVSVGFMLNEALASQLKAITGSDVAFGMGGRVLTTTLPREDDAALNPSLRSSRVSTVVLGRDEYVVLPQQLAGSTSGSEDSSPRPMALILRSRTEQLRSLDAIHTGLFVTAVIAVLLATLLSFAVARTITRPLAAITDVMREVATTGDLTRKIVLGEGRRWHDEDAQLLATTFNTLTDSVARFQREISQKERLSSLGRLSTVIAHEVRNPLMIIKGSLHALRQPDVTGPAVREAVADIDEEVERLNRIVNEVLDFARPIRFELAPADLNALCRESATASAASGPGAPVHLDLDPDAARLTTDAERLRIVLVNMLVNARHAVNGTGTRQSAVSSRQPAIGSRQSAANSQQPAVSSPQSAVDSPQSAVDSAEPLVTLRTQANNGRVLIVITDRGAGIEPAHLAHVFDPYFTTKRGGTGLGLAIAKNIVEGLGGTIGVNSTPGAGTVISISLPVVSS
jgi:signal transduction histidine kinase